LNCKIDLSVYQTNTLIELWSWIDCHISYEKDKRKREKEEEEKEGKVNFTIFMTKFETWQETLD